MLHRLKILPEYFQPVLEGLKTFEIRKNDRQYQVNDQVLLQEYDPEKPGYTGREVCRDITFITDYQQKDGYVVFSIDKISEGDW